MTKTFLKAEWRKLAIANFAVDKSLVNPYLPYKTELDDWENTYYVSLVGFMFLNTRVKGFQIPFHTNFEEVNLRFYVRYKDRENWKRGVVFIKEIVPRPAITCIANTLYKENYVTMPMDHSCIITENSLDVEYRWKKVRWNSFRINASTARINIKEGSEEEFITEHFWGYTRINTTKTSEYEVEHPRWQVYPVKEYHIDADFGNVYGEPFRFLLHEKPKSVFLAEGSEISVREGVCIK